MHNFLNIGDLCVFQDSTCNLHVGKVLQFSHYKKKYLYSAVSAPVNNKDLGVLCSWFLLDKSSSRMFSLLDHQIETQIFSNVKLCLSNCLEGCASTGCSTDITLTKDAMLHVEKLLDNCSITISDSEEAVPDTSNNPKCQDLNVWVKVDKQHILQNKKIDNDVINAFQLLVKKPFPNLCGLQNTL